MQPETFVDSETPAPLRPGDTRAVVDRLFEAGLPVGPYDLLERSDLQRDLGMYVQATSNFEAVRDEMHSIGDAIAEEEDWVLLGHGLQASARVRHRAFTRLQKELQREIVEAIVDALIDAGVTDPFVVMAAVRKRFPADFKPPRRRNGRRD